MLFCCVLHSPSSPSLQVLCILPYRFQLGAFYYYQLVEHCPFLVLQTQGEMVAGREMSVTVEFTNPLKQTLENVTLRLEGPGVLRTMKKEFG